MAYSIKTKIIGFRVQLGREIAKKKSTKSEQSTGKLCFSNWIYYDKLPFQVLVIGASKNRDTLKRMNLKEDENQKEVGGTTEAKRKTPAEKKVNLLPKCAGAITANPNAKAPLPNEFGTTKVSGFFVTVG